MQQYEPLVIDPGHSYWKVFWKNKKIILPALVSAGPLKEAANGIFEPDYSTESIDNIAVETPFGLRYIGNLAKQSTTPPWAAFDRGKYARAEFMIPMLLGAMAEARVTGDTVVIVTAAPTEWAKDAAIKAQIEGHFQAEHIISRDGKRGERTVNVPYVYVVSETAGLLYSHLMDSSGEMAVEDYADQQVCSIDIGEHTTCVDITQGLKRVGKARSYTDLSMGEIHETVSRAIAAETGRFVPPWQVRDIVRGEEGYILHNVKGQVKHFDVMGLYRAEVAKAKDVLYSIAGQTIKNAADFSHILIGGGGSEVLGDVLTGIYPQAKILGQLATGQGLYNYGVRLCNQLNRI